MSISIFPKILLRLSGRIIPGSPVPHANPRRISILCQHAGFDDCRDLTDFKDAKDLIGCFLEDV